MARDTWDVYEGTGFKSVMVPNNDIPTILFIAQHYNAHYLLLPAPRQQLGKDLHRQRPGSALPPGRVDFELPHEALLHGPKHSIAGYWMGCQARERPIATRTKRALAATRKTVNSVVSCFVMR